MNRFLFVKLIAVFFVFGCATTTQTTAPPEEPEVIAEGRSITAEGIALLKTFEGESLCSGTSERRHCPYNDSSNYCTIGHGHLIKKDACENIPYILSDLGFASGISDERAEEIFREDLTIAQEALEANTIHEATATNPGLTDFQYDALVSFIYNVGGGNYRDSELLEKLNARRSIEGNQDIVYQFRRWNKSGGQFVPGLLNRRNNEINHFYTDFIVPEAPQTLRRTVPSAPGAPPPVYVDPWVSDGIDIETGE